MLLAFAYMIPTTITPGQPRLGITATTMPPPRGYILGRTVSVLVAAPGEGARCQARATEPPRGSGRQRSESARFTTRPVMPALFSSLVAATGSTRSFAVKLT